MHSQSRHTPQSFADVVDKHVQAILHEAFVYADSADTSSNFLLKDAINNALLSFEITSTRNRLVRSLEEKLMMEASNG